MAGPGTYITDIPHRYNAETNDDAPTKYQNRSVGTRANNTRAPARKIKKNTMSHAATPTIPVVTAKVGMYPNPAWNGVFQKSVWLIAGSLYCRHASTNLFGPVPKNIFSPYTFRAISNVAPKDGRTSTYEISVRFDTSCPTEDPPTIKIADIIKTRTESTIDTTVLLAPPSSAPSPKRFFVSEYMSTTKLTRPSTIQIAKKLTIARMQSERSDTATNSPFPIFVNGNCSMATSASKSASPKKSARSFHPPSGEAVALVKIPSVNTSGPNKIRTT